MLSYNRSVIPIIESAYEELTNVEKILLIISLIKLKMKIYHQKRFLKDYMYLKHPYHGLLKS